MMRSVGFYDWAWNPVEGCLHGCDYCYASKDFHEKGKPFTPKFYEERLIEPSLVGPAKIFVTHYTDLMGDFIPKEWVEAIINECKSLPKSEFIFITKNPINYFKYDWPANCVLGVTIESPEQWNGAHIMKGLPTRQMASIEPLLGSFRGYDFSQFELVVVGALMYVGKKPNADWINSIKHDNIFYKPNVRGYLK